MELSSYLFTVNWPFVLGAVHGVVIGLVFTYWLFRYAERKRKFADVYLCFGDETEIVGSFATHWVMVHFMWWADHQWIERERVSLPALREDEVEHMQHTYRHYQAPGSRW